MTNSLVKLIVLAIGSLSLSQLWGQTLQNELDNVVDHYYYDGPGYVIKISQDGKLLYEKAIGLANISIGEELTVDHIFRIGSISKQFTAIAILQLIEQGTICLNDPLSAFIKDYPQMKDVITIEHLLTHTSGIKNYTDIDTWTEEMRTLPIRPLQLIELFKNIPIEYYPGTEFRYNNSGYVLLGYIIEKVSGLSYSEYLDKYIFVPLELNDTFYGDGDFDKTNRAIGYTVYEYGEYIRDRALHMDHPYAAGALVSTASDLEKWTNAIFEDQFISDSLMKLAHTNYVLTDGESVNYGYGWFLNEINETKVIRHSGGINGFSTAMAYLPNEKLFITVLSNSKHKSSDLLMKELVMTCLNIPKSTPEEIRVDPDQLKLYSGVYEFDNQELYYVSLEKNHLVIKGKDQEKVVLSPVGKHTFYIYTVDYKIRFNINRKNETKSMSVYSDKVDIGRKLN